VSETKFSPVAFDPKGYAVNRRKSEPKFAKAYDALNDEFAELAAHLSARKPTKDMRPKNV
jgi:cytochrome c553